MHTARGVSSGINFKADETYLTAIKSDGTKVKFQLDGHVCDTSNNRKIAKSSTKMFLTFERLNFKTFRRENMNFQETCNEG